MSIFPSLVFGFLALTSIVAPAHAADYGQCSTDRCFSQQPEELKARVLNGEAVVVTASDRASPYDMVYAFKRVRSADPELIAGLFASSDELPAHIEAIASSRVLRRSGNTAVLGYELDVKRLAGSADVGALVAKAPVSRYAVTNHFEKSEGGSYLIWWEIEPKETERLNPRKGLFGGLVGNLGEPEHIHGYLMAEPVPGTSDSVITYANYVVPKSAMARAAAGTINATSRTVLSSLVTSIGSWAESVSAKDASAQKRYRDRICEIMLTR